MVLRALVVEDLEAVSALCIAAFTRAVAPSLSAQGIATFAQIASADGFRSRMAGDNEILVMVDDAGLQRGVELKQAGAAAAVRRAGAPAAGHRSCAGVGRDRTRARTC